MDEKGLLIDSLQLNGGGGGGNAEGQIQQKQKVTRRKLHRSKSVVRQIFQQQRERKGQQAEEDDPRTKNIRQVNLL
jgi:hypothetical protein